MTIHQKSILDVKTPAQIIEESEDVGRNVSENPTMGDIINRRFSRRGFLGGSLAVAAIATTVSPMALMLADEAQAATGSAFNFDEIDVAIDPNHFVAPGYDADVLIRWGDKVFADAPEFDPMKQSAEAQAKQFGYNNDYVGFFPLDGAADRGILVVNHEYTNPELMFPAWATIGKNDKGEDEVKMGEWSKELVDIEMAAHGGTIIEIAKVDGKWTPVLDSKYNRRIHVGTEMLVTGPAAGHARLQTIADTTGTKVLGTLNNCAGGMSPWGTYLMAEENFHGYFMGKMEETAPEFANYKRVGAPAGSYNWGKFHDRFDVTKEPNEANRFGWIVEVDPLDPTSVP
ncbi:MAG: PhoX family protein, partial [Notoacmeibacter sp.]